MTLYIMVQKTTRDRKITVFTLYLYYIYIIFYTVLEFQISQLYDLQIMNETQRLENSTSQ